MEFDGFSAEGLALLRKLPSLDAKGFAANKRAYQRDIADPAKAFVVDIGGALQARISPEIVAQPKTNGSIAPINNDLRFTPDKAAYKDHLLFKFWEGGSKKLAPTLWLRVSAKQVGFASGVVLDATGLARWRAAVDDVRSGKALSAALTRLQKSAKGKLDVVGQDLKRVPAPYPAEHPRADLLRHKGLHVRWPEPAPASISSARFVDWCGTRLERLAPLHRWLVEHIG